MPAFDRFAKLEQLGWLPSADDWNVLRQICNQFAHAYPDTANERFDRLQAAIGAAQQMITVMVPIEGKIRQCFAGRSVAPTDPRASMKNEAITITMRRTAPQIHSIKQVALEVFGSAAPGQALQPNYRMAQQTGVPL